MPSRRRSPVTTAILGRSAFGRNCTAIVSAGTLRSFRGSCTSPPPTSSKPDPAVSTCGLSLGSSLRYSPPTPNSPTAASCKTGSRPSGARVPDRGAHQECRQRAGTQAIGTLTIILALITAASATAHVASHNSAGAATVVRVYMDNSTSICRESGFRLAGSSSASRTEERSSTHSRSKVSPLPPVHVKSTVVMRVTLVRTPEHYQCTIPGHFTWGMYGSLRSLREQRASSPERPPKPRLTMFVERRNCSASAGSGSRRELLVLVRARSCGRSRADRGSGGRG